LPVRVHLQHEQKGRKKRGERRGKCHRSCPERGREKGEKGGRRGEGGPKLPGFPLPGDGEKREKRGKDKRENKRDENSIAWACRRKKGKRREGKAAASSTLYVVAWNDWKGKREGKGGGSVEKVGNFTLECGLAKKPRGREKKGGVAHVLLPGGRRLRKRKEGKREKKRKDFAHSRFGLNFRKRGGREEKGKWLKGKKCGEIIDFTPISSNRTIRKRIERFGKKEKGWLKPRSSLTGCPDSMGLKGERERNREKKRGKKKEECWLDATLWKGKGKERRGCDRHLLVLI